jgi:hypothetical protein
MIDGGDGSRRKTGGDHDSVEVVPMHSVHVPRRWTLSIAMPGSILDNAMHKSAELQASLASQVARAAAVFCVDEIVVFREGPRNAQDDATETLALLLRYLDTPQYLRRHLFPMSETLKHVGLMHPLNLPNHFAKDEIPRWRDGVVMPVGRSFSSRSRQSGPKPWKGDGPRSRYVEVGLSRLVEVDQLLPTCTRVTVDMQASGEGYGACPGKYLFGKVVSRNAPREQAGVYWGFDVRVADSLLDSLTPPSQQDEYAEEDMQYDLVIGTSEHGTPAGAQPGVPSPFPLTLPEFSRCMIVFGGVHGLEHSARCDERLAKAGIGAATSNAVPLAELFDFYINTCPRQGSRTIRTEEAIPISLATLQPFLRPRG